MDTEASPETVRRYRCFAATPRIIQPGPVWMTATRLFDTIATRKLPIRMVAGSRHLKFARHCFPRAASRTPHQQRARLGASVFHYGSEGLSYGAACPTLF